MCLHYVFPDLATGEVSWIFGRDGRGIGAIAVHPSRKYFAVGEKGDSPNVYIHEYPSLAVFRVLRKGTERAFSDLSFSADGKLLATVGAAPDFLLTVWEWEFERMTLRTKAFSQEVRCCLMGSSRVPLVRLEPREHREWLNGCGGRFSTSASHQRTLVG